MFMPFKLLFRQNDFTAPGFVAEGIMIAEADVVSMECVDEIKVPPHEPIAAVHGSKTTLGNAAPGIELTPGSEAVLLKHLGRHAAWLEGNLVVAIAFIEPPVVVQQSAFGL